MSWLFKNWYYLYAHQTEPEKAMERAVCKLGERYRAQHLFPGLKHIADFALPDRKLIIEVDGASHMTEAQRIKDLVHTLALTKLGWTVVRCTNEDVQRAPDETLAGLLTAQAPTLGELQAALASYPPELLSPPKRRKRKPGTPRPSAKTPSARKGRLPKAA